MEEAKKGTCYYVSDKGLDTNSGTSPETPWKTVEKVNGSVFLPGDQVLFEGGGIFEGPLIIGSESGGEPECPVVISSYGEGRAVIQGKLDHGVEINRVSGITVQNINVAGPGRNVNELGVGIRPAGSTHIVIDQVEVWGFQLAGILVTEGCSKVRVTRAYAHHNGYTGIGTGYRDRSKTPNRDIYIGYCRAMSNPGISNPDMYIRDQTGSGINLYFADGALVEFCEAGNNGYDAYAPVPNGPVGIWTVFSRNVMVQYCISHDNKSHAGDGGGFDMDSGSKNCLFQYNYSYNNYGCGYLICAYNDTEEHSLKDNTLRFCISENDGWDPGHNAGIHVYNGNVQTADVYNNIIYNQDGRGCVTTHKPNPAMRFFNNIFILKGSGSFLKIRENQESGYPTFAGNCYWRMDGERYVSRWCDAENLETFRALTGMEMLDGAPVGIFADPMISDPGRGEKLTDPSRLPELFSYLLKDESPCREGGINLKERFGLDIGERDFFGSTLDENGETFIGAHKK